MRAIRIDEPGALGIVELDAPSPAASEVVVDVAFAGICGSDVELFAGGRPPGFVRYPIVPGHEWSGTVHAVGEGVDAGLLGRKVVGEGFRSCRTCAPCHAGDTVLCERGYDEIGFTAPGAWAEQLVLGADQLHLLGDDADLLSAAALEPAACSAEAVSQAALVAGERIAVVGAGAIGALAVQLARAARPSEIVDVEPDPHRAATAERCGATRTITPEQAAKGPGGFDVVIEAAGSLGSARLALGLVRRGGRLVLAGIPGADATLPVRDLVAARVDVSTVFGAPRQAWRDAVRAFDEGLLDPGLLVTHELDLADAAAALRLLTAPDDHTGKVLLRP